MDFIKRLQVAVSGNLQSAAEIKATSIDLANNTKTCAEEIKTLRHVCALIKHEVQSLCPQQPQQNPFTNTQNLQTDVNQSDSISMQRDREQTQLSLTAKLNKSLEQELVSAKLQHANEVQ